MVAFASFLLVFFISVVQPFEIEYPQEISENQELTLSIVCSEPGCSGISIVNGLIRSSSGLIFAGSSTSTQISSVSTPNGQQLTQIVVFNINFVPTSPGEQTIGPLEVNIGGFGVYTLDQFTVNVVSASNSSTTSTATATRNVNQIQPEREVWLQGILQDPNGKIYPGTILTLDYFVHATVDVSDITYYWVAPELGVIHSVETISDSNWASSPIKNDTSRRSRLAIVEMSPAAAGSLLAPVFSADIIGEGFNRWGKQPLWYIESDPIILPVYPFPENPPEGWNSALLDSVMVKIEQLPTPPGQGGELTVRVSCLGPGKIYMNSPPDISISGAANLIEADKGSSLNKKWWDFIVEPEENGQIILGPDSVVWLNRTTGTYITEEISPCSLDVAVIPWGNSEIVLPDEEGKRRPLIWLISAIISIIGLTVILGITARKRDKRLVSVTSAKDIDELISGLENELSILLTGKKEYLGYEELDEFLNNCDTDSFLARRILRFWRDLEKSLSGKEITTKDFEQLKITADELLYKLRKDLRLNEEKEKEEA